MSKMNNIEFEVDGEELEAEATETVAQEESQADGDVEETVGNPQLFSSAHVEEMAERLLLNELVTALGGLNQEINAQFNAFQARINELEEEVTSLRGDMTVVTDFAADAEIAFHRVSGFPEMSEPVQPNLSYQDVLKEFGLSSAFGVLNGNTKPVVPRAPQKESLSSKEKITAPSKTYNTKDKKAADEADRMFDLLG